MDALWKLLRKAFVYGLSQGAGRLLNLVALPILTHHLTTEDYGAIAVLAVGGTALRILFGAGAAAAAGIVYFRQDDPGYRAVVVWSLALVTGLSALLMVLAVLPLAEAAGRVLFSADGFGWLIVLYVAALALQLLAEPFLVRFQLEGQAASYATLTVTGGAVGLGASVYLVAVEGLAVDGWIIGQLIGSVLLVVTTAAWLFPRLPRPRASWAVVRAILAAGLPLVPGSFAMLALSQSAPFFVARLSDLSSAGVFGVGYQLGMAMGMATAAVSAAWTPFFLGYVTRQDEAARLFPRLANAYVVGFGLLTLAFFGLAPLLVGVLAAPEFHLAWRVVGPVALTQVLLGLWSMLLPGMYYASDTGYVSLMQIVAAVITVILHILLVPALGPVGAAFALVLGCLMLIFLQLMFNRLRGYRVQAVNPAQFLLLVAVVMAACGAIWAGWRGAPAGL